VAVFVGVVVLKFPLLEVVLAMAPVSIGLCYLQVRR
jgi:hypothetical protein